MKFLDEINAKQQKQIDGELVRISKRYCPFRLETDEPGVFEGRDSIRVLWLGLAGDLQQLHSISSDIDRALAAIGFPPERRSYTPHITIGQDILFNSPFGRIKETVGY